MIKNRVKYYADKKYPHLTVAERLEKISLDTTLSYRSLRTYYYNERQLKGHALTILADYFGIPASKITNNTLIYLAS